MATGFGGKAVRMTNGGEVRTNSYVIPASDSTVYGLGEAVKLAGAIDTATGLPTVIIAAAGDALVGFIQGFEPDPTSPYTGDYRAASIRRVVQVADQPGTVFQIQEDAVGGSVSAADVGAMLNADLVISAATATTRVSGTMLDSNTATAGSAQVKIVGILRDDVNAAAQSGGAILEVVIHELAKTVSDSIT